MGNLRLKSKGPLDLRKAKSQACDVVQVWRAGVGRWQPPPTRRRKRWMGTPGGIADEPASIVTVSSNWPTFCPLHNTPGFKATSKWCSFQHTGLFIDRIEKGRRAGGGNQCVLLLFGIASFPDTAIPEGSRTASCLHEPQGKQPCDTPWITQPSCG